MHTEPRAFVEWFRAVSPYVHGHRGRTLVLCIGGEVVAGPIFPSLIHDIALLHALGLRQVLVYGTRPQIEQCMGERGASVPYVDDLRVTDDEALACVKAAAGSVRVEIEALLSMGLANSPMANARIRVASGNFIVARPIGVRGGVDFRYTGVVRRVDAEAIGARLDQGEVVLIPPVGYSPTGEVFNLDADDVATAVAMDLRAAKLLFLIDAPGLVDASGQLIRELTDRDAEGLLDDQRRAGRVCSELECAVRACRNGVARVHLIDQGRDGALLLELFQRDGIGTLVSASPFDELRPASIEDVGGILELIAPLEAEGILMRRSREKFEMEIERFKVIVRDGAIIGCAALYPYPAEGLAELACLAVHPDYRNVGRGHELLDTLERDAKTSGLGKLFVLSTETAHWFIERGFREAAIEELPMARQDLYNYQRNSKVFIKPL